MQHLTLLQPQALSGHSPLWQLILLLFNFTIASQSEKVLPCWSGDHECHRLEAHDGSGEGQSGHA